MTSPLEETVTAPRRKTGHMTMPVGSEVQLMAPQILRVRRTSRPNAGAVAVDVMGRQGEAGTEGADDALQALEELLAGPVDLG